MSGTTNRLFDLRDLIGDDILGDQQTRDLNRTLDDLGDVLDDADDRLDNLATDVEIAADDVVATAAAALDDADAQLEDLVDSLVAGGDAIGSGAPELVAAVTNAVSAVQDAPGRAAALLGDESVLAWVTPTNNSGGQALARLALDGGTLSVTIEGSGFTPGQAHAISLAGFADGRISETPTLAQDADANGLLDAVEVASVTGPVLLALGAPVADAEGNISFSTTVAPDAAALEALQTRLDGRHIGIEGIDAPGPATGFQATTPAAGGRTLDVPGELGAVLDVLTALSPGLAGDAFRALLDAQAPYTLSPDGTDAIAPEPTGAADTDVAEYVALIQPSNNSGVLGAARLTIDEGAGTVEVQLELGGLTPGAEHPIHVHGFSTGQPSLVPNAQLDIDTDGFLEGGEVAGVLGFILFGVTADGSISDANLTANFPVADAEGRISLDRTYSFDLSDPAEATIFAELQDRLTGRQLEVHGATLLDGQGEGTAGEAAGQGGYSIGLPVATGAVLPVSGIAGALAAGVGYVVQSELTGEEATLAGLLEAVGPAFDLGGSGGTVPAAETLIG
jgi:hypothetical protein